MRLLDLFCGRWGWSRAFAARGWECVGVDWNAPSEIPERCKFLLLNVLLIDLAYVKNMHFDFIVCSSPCEEFSVWGMKHFHPNPKYPEMGIKLFNHSRAILEASGVPYVMENVKPAQKFVGQADSRCGSFYLWGNAIPPIMPQGIRKGATQMRRDGRYKRHGGVDEQMYKAKDVRAANLATIPPELASCVADYAERLLEQKSGWRKISKAATLTASHGHAWTGVRNSPELMPVLAAPQGASPARLAHAAGRGTPRHTPRSGSWSHARTGLPA
jgi:hypothetical protein